MRTYKTIAALGSSFASGPGIEPVADAGAMRSAKNYAHQLAERLEAELVDLSVSGATTANVVDTPQQSPDGSVFPPQVDGLPTDADAITVTAGGNDLQFAGAMSYVAWLRLEPESPIVAMLGAMLPDGIPAPTAEAVEAATAGLVTVVERAREKAPNARVLLVDYLTVLDSDSLGHTPFTADELEQFLDIQTAIRKVFRDAAAQTNADLVRASALSTGHALGSSDPWVQSFRPDTATMAGSFHPNAAGMTAIARELERILRV
jgi:lysophospholipase L1-like esterase